MSIFSKITLIMLLLLLSGPIPLFSDDREENIDVFLVLDKSLSMVEEIDAVTDYVKEEIVEKILIDGDFFLLLQFYGNAEVLFATEVGSLEERQEELTRTVKAIAADGYYTDIGNALDRLQGTLKRYDARERRRYMLLITDGKQEAPPQSKYYSPDGSFSHEFLDNSKIIQKQGWKIHILGIGAGNAAKELADALSGTYSETDDEPTVEEIAEETQELLGSIILKDQPRARDFSRRGTSRLKLQLESTGYAEAQEISIDGVYFNLPGGERLVAQDILLSIDPDSAARYTIPLRLPDADSLAGETVEVRVDFAPGPVFTPAVFDAEVVPLGFFARYWPYLLAGLLVLLLILLIILLISRGAFRGRHLLIEVNFEDGDRSKTVDLKGNDQLFVCEGISGLEVALTKAGDLLATLHAEGDELLIKTEDPEILLAGEIRGNILGKTLKFRDRYGKFRAITFNRKAG